VGDGGFVGIKLYNEYTCTEPVIFPVVEPAMRSWRRKSKVIATD
jgi:hypothetical protein